MKKLMILGGSRYILPIIRAAHELGLYVITCDYLPENIAHRYSDEYCNVSIIEKDKVLDAARRRNVNGIMSFACDPGVETAAYVAEKMGLPSCGSYESVCILQDKEKFRSFLKKHGFNVPKAKGYVAVNDAMKDINDFRWPVIVKPADSAGSKGVTRIDRPEELQRAAEYAIGFSKTRRFIVEEFIEKKGNSSDSDCFSVDGKLVYTSFSNQFFDDTAENPYTPAGYSWPSDMSEEGQRILRSELQRLITLLHLGTSIYNIETREGTDGKPYIMEVSPRGGGNRLSEMLDFATGTELIKNTVRAAIGEPVVGIDHDPIYNGYWAIVILHADSDGAFSHLWLAPAFEAENVVEKDIWIEKGTPVHAFTGANETIGTLVIRFETQEQLREIMNNIDRYVKVIVK